VNDLDQLGELKEIGDTELAATSRSGDEHVGLDGIGPGRREGGLSPILEEEENSVLEPGLADNEEFERLAKPGMKRVRYSNGLP
jgi:hypothetical protein